MEQNFRLDKTAFKASTAKEADDHVSEWGDKAPWKRLESAWVLINLVYGTTSKTKLDRTVFSKRKRNTEYSQ